MKSFVDEAKLAAGKLPASLLNELLADLPTTDPQLLLGPAVGEDAAVIDFASEGLGSAFQFKNPNATDECGCGESFTIG